MATAEVAADRLAELQALPENWNGYGEPPITINAIRRAGTLLASLSEHPMPHIAPTVDGGIQLEWRGEDGEAEVEIGPDGTAQAFGANSGGVQQEFVVDDSDLRRLRTLIAATRQAGL